MKKKSSIEILEYEGAQWFNTNKATSKYIRTTRYVYETVGENDLFFSSKVKYVGYTICVFVKKESVIAQSDNILDLIDEVIQISLGTSGKPQLVAKWLWEDDADFDPEQEEMYGSIWVTGDNGAPTLKPVIKKIEIGKWEFI